VKKYFSHLASFIFLATMALPVNASAQYIGYSGPVPNNSGIPSVFLITPSSAVYFPGETIGVLGANFNKTISVSIARESKAAVILPAENIHLLSNMTMNITLPVDLFAGQQSGVYAMKLSNGVATSSPYYFSVSIPASVSNKTPTPLSTQTSPQNSSQKTTEYKCPTYPDVPGFPASSCTGQSVTNPNKTCSYQSMPTDVSNAYPVYVCGQYPNQSLDGHITNFIYTYAQAQLIPAPDHKPITSGTLVASCPDIIVGASGPSYKLPCQKSLLVPYSDQYPFANGYCYYRPLETNAQCNIKVASPLSTTLAVNNLATLFEGFLKWFVGM
jgi:hypothetical protein